jgi:hypothetical protein
MYRWGVRTPIIPRDCPRDDANQRLQGQRQPIQLIAEAKEREGSGEEVQNMSSA